MKYYRNYGIKNKFGRRFRFRDAVFSILNLGDLVIKLFNEPKLVPFVYLSLNFMN